MTRDPEAYARGYVRHLDHRIITVPFWHRVLPSLESRTNSDGEVMDSVAFLN